MRRRASLLSLIPVAALVAGFLLLSPAAQAAAAQRVATILVQGLQRIERDQLLQDLRLQEGDALGADFEGVLVRRARQLSYLSSLRIESREGDRGLHLTLRVRESQRLVFAPTLLTLDDGELDGGLRVDASALLGRAEHWQGRILVGTYAEGVLALRNLRLVSGLPTFTGEIGVSDYDNPFIQGNVTRWWGLGGPSFRLPAGGQLDLRIGWERMDSDPALGRDPDGSEAHVLSHLDWIQPLGSARLSLGTELRNPTDERGYGRGQLALDAWRIQGRWRLEGRLAAGLANHWSPAVEIHQMAAWSYLRAYDPEEFPTREFHFARLRGDLALFHLPIRLRRGAQAERAALGPYFLLEGARFREYRHHDFKDMGDWGLGLSLLLPLRQPLRASFGLQWDDRGVARSIFILEER